MAFAAWNTRAGLVAVSIAGLALAGVTGCGSSGGGESGGPRQDASKITDPVERADVLIRQANSQIKSKDISGAAQKLSQANRAVDEIRDHAKQAEILARIGAAYNKAGKKGDAAKVAERGAAATKKISDTNEKLARASRLAGVLAEADEDGRGLSLLRAVEPDLSKIADYGLRAAAKCNIAVAYHALGKPAEVKRIVDELVQQSTSHANPEERLTALVSVGNAQLKMKDSAGAKKTFDAAAQQVDQVPSLARRAFLLCDLAKGYKSAGDDAAKDKALEKALQYAEKDPQPDLAKEAKDHVLKTRRELK
jgi:tetratricopeptide (TPR) repeat protein